MVSSSQVSDWFNQDGDLSVPSRINTPNIITTGLRLNLDATNPTSYSGSGTTWYDLTANGFNATLQNGTTFSSLDGNGCFILDGVNDYISLPTNGFGAASLSIEWWIKKTPGADVDGYIHVTDSLDNPETRFSMNSTNFVATVYDGGAYRWNTNVATITTDTWYHAVATMTNGSQKFYVNGVQTATNSGFYDGSGGNIGEHTFGTYNRPGTGYGGYFAGKLGAYRYYTAVLTAAEVLQNFNATRSRYGI
jgi:hypothetical protein